MKEGLNIKVYVIDDDAVFSDTLVRYLREECFPTPRVETFGTGEECLKKMNEMPDVVLLDYYLNSKIPEAMNGLGVLKQLRNKFSEIPVIMLSSQDNIETAIELVNNGAYDYVIKNESAFIRVKNMIEKLAGNLESKGELQKRVSFYKIVNLIVVLLIIVLFLISLYII